MKRTIVPNSCHNHYHIDSLNIHRIDLPKVQAQSKGWIHNTLKLFYVQYLRKYVVMRWLARTWHYGYLLYTRLISLFSEPAMRKFLPLIPLSRYFHIDMKKYEITRAHWINVPMPAVFPTTDCHIFSDHLYYHFPPIQVVTIPQAVVYGGTNLTMSANGVIHHDWYDFKCDSISEELHNQVIIQQKKNQIQWLIDDPNPEYIDCAATFVDACASNYAHWMSEVLPRIALFCADRRFHSVVIIINSDLHHNIMESLYTLLRREQRTILLLATGRAIVCRTLYILSATGYVPFQKRKGTNPNNSHGIFNPVPFQVLRQTLHQKEIATARIKAENHCYGYPKKIYIKRNSYIRNMSNTAAIEKLLIRQGYTIVEPEKLSFVAQRALFLHAEVIIGTTGSACANAIFSRPGTHIVILMGKHQDMVYRYWLTMLSPIGITVHYVLGHTTQTQALGIHSDFTIDLSDMMDALTLVENT